MAALTKIRIPASDVHSLREIHNLWNSDPKNPEWPGVELSTGNDADGKTELNVPTAALQFIRSLGLQFELP